MLFPRLLASVLPRLPASRAAAKASAIAAPLAFIAAATAAVLAPAAARADKIVESEPNGTMATANPLVGFNDLQALGTITQSPTGLTEVDFFSFRVQSAGNVQLLLLGRSFNSGLPNPSTPSAYAGSDVLTLLDPFFALRARTGALLATNEDGPFGTPYNQGVGFNSEINVVLSPDIYFVQVDTSGRSGSYRLEVRGVQAPGAAAAVVVGTAAVIPEPGTLALLGTGLLPLTSALVRSRRRHKTPSA